ncbi:multidrug transporter, partial [Neisseria meningitidis]|uniref:TolC family protein n=1 Tax=Neisseria meningitidis TaxID=487 RepID=UPI000CB63DFD
HEKEVGETDKDVTATSDFRVIDLGGNECLADRGRQKRIKIALEGNTSLGTAVLNSEIYRKHYMIERNNLLPTLAANANDARQGSWSGGNVSGSYKVGLGAASYELDLFGRVRSSSEAALQGYFASTANRDAAHLSLIATVAKSYFTERYVVVAMSLAQRVLKTREEPYNQFDISDKADATPAVSVSQEEKRIQSAQAASAPEDREAVFYFP